MSSFNGTEFEDLGEFILHISWIEWLLHSGCLDWNELLSTIDANPQTGSRSFQNYAFKGWLFLETMKLWLLVLTKTLLLMTLICISAIDAPARGPRGLGCQKMLQDLLNMPLEVWCAKIAPKMKNIQKSLRKQGFFWHFFFNFDGFWSLCLLGQS